MLVFGGVKNWCLDLPGKLPRWVKFRPLQGGATAEETQRLKEKAAAKLNFSEDPSSNWWEELVHVPKIQKKMLAWCYLKTDQSCEILLLKCLGGRKLTSACRFFLGTPTNFWKKIYKYVMWMSQTKASPPLPQKDAGSLAKIVGLYIYHILDPMG